ncbi:MAG: site-specific integrase [Phycisphaerales bacterium]|nr:site-specific integrase [Phycisphaerales bacterium]
MGKLRQANPVERIAVRNESGDQRKKRRALTVDEAYRLLDASGPRRLFYTIQLWTGLRVNETRTLEWRDVVLDGPRPVLRLRAAATKAKRADELPLHPDLAAELRAIRPVDAAPTDRVFRFAPILRTLKDDLKRAGIAFCDDNGRTVDRHALRTTFVSWLGQRGVDPRAQITLARHAPTGITLRHYQDFTLFDLRAEIAKLPPTRRPGASDALRATGTCDVRPTDSPAVVLPVVLNTGKTAREVAFGGTVRRNGDFQETAVCTAKNGVSWRKTNWAVRDSNGIS